MLPPQAGAPPRRQFEFVASRPVRYLAFIASRFARADRVTVAFDNAAAEGGRGNTPFATTAPAMGGAVYDSMTLTVDANPLQVPRGRQLINDAADVVRFYDSLIGDAPYGSFTIALVEHVQPGGHSPAYFAALNQPLPNTPLRWQSDPVNFEGFPEFFLAHEVAHQWWGQAVGWRNYHEQWLSEGFSQYFAALYAEHRYGDQVFGDMLRQLRKWAIDRSDQGPVYLGYRLGHIRNQPTVFRALVYNKGALVLHMLRRLVGDDAFFAGVKRYYKERRYAKAGTDDLRSAMEAESGRSLARFFERWVFDSGVPRVRYSASIGAEEVTVRLEQSGDVYDLPVTVTLQHADGKVQEEVVVLTEAVTEARIPVKGGPVRTVDINQDHASLAHFERAR
jgi:Peptidase family M1 domain